MKVLRRIGILVLIVLFLTVGVCYAQSIAEERYDKGMEYAVQGEFEKAKEEFEKALKIDPFYTLAKESLKFIEDVIDQKIKGKTVIHLFKGMAYINKGKLDEGIAEFNQAITIDPNFASAYNNRGLAYYFKREYDKAWEDVYNAQSLGYQVALEFLKALRKASGRQR